MHYERAPRSEDRSWMRRRLRSATAALGSNCSGACGGKEVQEGIGKSAGEWHFTLRDGPTDNSECFYPLGSPRLVVNRFFVLVLIDHRVALPNRRSAEKPPF